MPSKARKLDVIRACITYGETAPHDIAALTSALLSSGQNSLDAQ
jgi:hypothetical protein